MKRSILRVFVVVVLCGLSCAIEPDPDLPPDPAVQTEAAEIEVAPASALACVCTAPRCTGEDPDFECGGNRVCKFLNACGWRCQGGFLDLCVAI